MAAVLAAGGDVCGGLPKPWKRRLDALEAGPRRICGGGDAPEPGPWRDQELAARPALQAAAAGERVCGGRRHRRNAAWHAAQAPAEGFARSSAAAIAKAAAGPRLLDFAGSGGSPKAEAEQPCAEDTGIVHGKFDLADVGIGVAPGCWLAPDWSSQAVASADGFAAGWRLAEVSDSTVTKEMEDVGEEIVEEVVVEGGVGEVPLLSTVAPQFDNDDFQFGQLELSAVQRIAELPKLEGRLRDDFGIQLETRVQWADESDYGIDEVPKDVGLDMDEERASIGPSDVSRGAAVHDDYAALAETFKAKAKALQ
ncbi:unnamed protein product, partial [Prorocentrum cordatum]